MGYAFDNVLPYVKGGFAFADVDYEGGDIDANGFDPFYSYDDSESCTGFAIGGGVEYGISEEISVKAEYLYLDFGQIDVEDEGDRSYEIDDYVHTVKIGINWIF